VSFRFVKGHGTHNDFIVLPDLDGSVHGDLDAGVVAALCDRRSGIGADGVLRVVRSTGPSEWFMDYRNADGSISEMCGNGVRVFARYLAREGLVAPSGSFAVDTRDGAKLVSFCDDGDVSVDMGRGEVGEPVKVAVEGRTLDAVAVAVGTPHAVAFVDSLDQAGDLRAAPDFSADDFPNGVNVEFAVLRGPGDVAMRVYERGVGETQSCGTGACAVAFAAAAHAGDEGPTTWRVEVPGGVVWVTHDDARRLHLKGPAVLVADGVWTG
jgi:diaminopimelate epimerase